MTHVAAVTAAPAPDEEKKLGLPFFVALHIKREGGDYSNELFLL